MTTYSIQLDDLDLALLQVPSLSYNHVLKKEQFQFQLLIKEEAEDQHPCHICAIDVPTAFWSEHSAGAKHRANARIATVAAQRTSALITATPPPKIPITTEQFCDSCTCIAGKDHDKTKAHKLSVTQDRMLFNLVMIYTGEDVNDDQREKENKTDSKFAKKDKDKEVDVNVIKREVNHFSNSENDEGPTANTPYEKDIADIDLVKLNDDQFSDVENEKRTTTKIPNEDIQKNADETILDGEIETIPINDTQLSTFEDKMSNAIHLPNQNETQKTASTIPDDNGEINVKRTRTRRRKNKSQLVSETNIITTEDTNVNEGASNKELNVPDPNNKGFDVKDAFVSYYPLVDESAVHYPFIKDMLHVRCLICDCIVPRTVYNRVTHLKGRPHAANAKKQLHIVKDAFILAKKQINDVN